jgi:hypothetical protein
VRLALTVIDKLRVDHPFARELSQGFGQAARTCRHREIDPVLACESVGASVGTPLRQVHNGRLVRERRGADEGVGRVGLVAVLIFPAPVFVLVLAVIGPERGRGRLNALRDVVTDDLSAKNL